MTHSVEILPCRPQNSIDSMGLILYFKDSLQLEKAHWESVNANEYLKNLFDQISWHEFDRGNRIVFEKFDAPDKVLWKIELTNGRFKFMHKDYRRWKYSIDFCINVLKNVELLKDSIITVIFLGYLDIFTVKDVEKFNYSMLYKESEYIPSIFFGNFFADTTVEIPGFADDKCVVQTKVKLSATPAFGDEQSLEYFELKCDLSSTKIVESLRLVDVVNSGDMLSMHLNPMHEKLNSLFKNLIQEDIQRKVGIEV